MKAYASTHVGKVRSINEDAFFVPENGESFAAVADGMGGHLAGEVASRMAIEAFASALRGRVIDEAALRQAVSEANASIYHEAQRDPLKHGMGTTLTAVCLWDGVVYLTHVGDSRAYLLRNRALMQLSNDHSLVNELMEQGKITPREALNHPQRNFITRALGTNRHVQPDILRIDYQAGDVWLLCSDGMSNYLRNYEIAAILMRDASWPEKLDMLTETALSRGGGDNITVVVVPGEEDDDA